MSGALFIIEAVDDIAARRVKGDDGAWWHQRRHSGGSIGNNRMSARRRASAWAQYVRDNGVTRAIKRGSGEKWRQ